MKKARTTLLSSIQQAFRAALAANNSDLPLDEFLEIEEEKALSRRQFLRRTTQTGLAVAASSLILPPLKGWAKNQAPKIAIVGAGIGGLNAGYYLRKAGLDFTIYEASRRTSGRMMSVQNAMAQGTWTEFGGEFIDTDHLEMHQLVKELNLSLLDVEAPTEKKLTKEMFFFNNQRYSQKDLVAAIQPYIGKIKADQDSLADEIDFQHKNNRDFDNISIDAYFEKIGLTGWVAEMLRVAYTGEYGLDTSVQSALNFISLLGTDVAEGDLKLFGESDERYKVIGGNQQIPNKLGEILKDHIQFGHTLVEVREPKTGGYVLTFEGQPEVKADYVVMAIPFTMLREVELKRLNLPEWKRRSIAYMSYGTNAKLMMGFSNRRWREQGYLGFMYHPEVHTGWDNSQLQNNNLGECGYSIFMGGKAGKNLGLTDAEKYLNIIESAFPGTKALHNGNKKIMNWGQNPFSKGSYSCYTTGQWTGIGFAEGIPVGNMFFAGEHCSLDFQGFMNGAAETGRKAAEDIIKKMK